VRNKFLLLGIVIILIITSIFIFEDKNKTDKTIYIDKVKSITIYAVDTKLV
jgi:hypothetical protein